MGNFFHLNSLSSFEQMSTPDLVLFMILVLGVLVLKGYALWVAAKRDEKWWFIVILFINTLGILELVYLGFVAKKFQVEVGKSV